MTEGFPKDLIPLDVAFHLRHSLRPRTATATVATPFVIPCVYHPSRTDLDHHSYTHVHLALYSLDHTARGGPDHLLNSLGIDLHDLRGHAAVDGHRLAKMTDVHRESQLAWRLALFPVSQKGREYFEDSLFSYEGLHIESTPRCPYSSLLL